MSENDLLSAEKRGYSKGYAAGRRKVKKDLSNERSRRERQAFLDRAYLAFLPAAINSQGLKIGEKAVTSARDRTELARLWAIEALIKRPRT